jgi:hypothetical protein
VHSSRPGCSQKAGDLRILVLGGYGVFGGRLAELLSDIPELELVICGRTFARAQKFCEEYQGPTKVRPLALARSDIEVGLRQQRPDLVVDASGPFQDYAVESYNVVTACIANKIHYLDFADAAGFVFGVSQFDAEARRAGVFVLSGVSSFPVLTAAVLRHMTKSMDIVSVEGGIAPSPFAGIGVNVMRAVLGYAGEPVKLLRNGQQTYGTGLAESMRFTIAVPGKLPLRNTRFSLVDVPDLQVIAPDHETLRDIWMGAGTRPELLHVVLNLLAKARAKAWIPSLVPFSAICHGVLNLMRFGEHRGGMFVRARGVKGGQAVEQTWHLLAEGDDGPFIPSMAIEGLVRKLMNGERPASGARPATRELELADYDRLFEDKAIYCGFRRDEPETVSLYRRMLGEAFDALPDKVQLLHDSTDKRQWVGHAEVRRGDGFIAKAVGWVIGFPAAASEVPVTVEFSVEEGGERWQRNFGGKVFSSLQKPGTNRNQHLLMERFGIINVALGLVVDADRLFLVPRKWFCLGIPLPRWLLPDGQSFEAEEDGRFRFNVEIAAPLVGLVVAYKGTLEPIAAADQIPIGASRADV